MRVALGSAAAIFVFGTLRASAADISEALLKCGALSADALRLACYDDVQRSLRIETPSVAPSRNIPPFTSERASDQNSGLVFTAAEPHPDESHKDASAFHVSVTPRFQYTFTDLTGIGNDAARLTDSIIELSTLQLPLFGGTLQLGRDDWNTDFVLTTYYGQGSGTLKLVAAVPLPPPFPGPAAFVGEGTYDASRFDIEALARYHIPDTSAYFLYGLRYVRVDVTATVPGAVLPTTGGATIEAVDDQYLIEVGGGASAPLNASGSWAIFTNFVAAADYSRISIPNRVDEGKLARAFLGPELDVSAGVTYALSDVAMAAARYRAIMALTSTNGNFQIIQGPEISLTYRF
jgi:hypothetical protein